VTVSSGGYSFSGFVDISLFQKKAHLTEVRAGKKKPVLRRALKGEWAEG